MSSTRTSTQRNNTLSFRRKAGRVISDAVTSTSVIEMATVHGQNRRTWVRVSTAIALTIVLLCTKEFFILPATGPAKLRCVECRFRKSKQSWIHGETGGATSIQCLCLE